MKNKMNFEEPVLNVIKFEASDIITTSGEEYEIENLPTVKCAEFNINA